MLYLPKDDISTPKWMITPCLPRCNKYQQEEKREKIIKHSTRLDATLWHIILLMPYKKRIQTVLHLSDGTIIGLIDSLLQSFALGK